MGSPMDDQAFIDLPTQPDLPDIEDSLARVVLEGDAGRARELADLYRQSVVRLKGSPEREVLLLRAADLLLDVGDTSGALEVLGLLEPSRAGAMRRQRARVLRRLDTGLLRDHDLMLVLDRLLPLLEGAPLRRRAAELMAVGQRLDEPKAVVDGCLAALTAGDPQADHLEEAARHLAERGHSDHLERLVDDGARAVLKGAARSRPDRLATLARLAEECLDDRARAARLWWETWRVEERPGDQSQAAANLRRIYQGLSAWIDLCRVLRRQVTLAPDEGTRAAALGRLAEVQAGEFAAAEDAARTRAELLQVRGLAASREPGGARGEALREQLRLEWGADRIHRFLWLLRRLDPGLAEDRRLVAELLDEPGDDEGEARLDEALQHGSLVLLRLLDGPGTGALVMALARRLEATGASRRAAAWYRSALAREPDNAEARARLDELSRPVPFTDPTHEELARTAGELTGDRPGEAARLLIQAAQLAGADGDDDDVHLTRATELALTLPPEELLTLVGLEEALRQAGRHPELASVLEATAAAETDALQRKHILCELGRIHLEAGHHPERAVAALQQALTLDPDDDAVALRLRDLQGTLKDHRSRARNLESLLAHSSGQERIPLTEELGAIYAEALDEEQAAAMHYEELLTRVPNHPKALPFCRAIYERAGDYVSVVRILGEAARVSDDRQTQAALHVDAARVAMQRLTDLDLAIHHWQDAIRARPEDLAQYEGLRQVLEAGGRWAELREALLSGVCRTISVEEKLPLYVELARVARKQEDDQGAAGYLLTALQLSPGDGELLAQLEGTYERMGQWRLLAVTLRRHAAHEADLAAQRRHQLRAARVLLIRLGRDDEALAICDRIVEAHPGDREASTLMGEILGKRGQWEEKIVLLRRQIERENDPGELGRLHLELGRVLLDRLDDVETASVHFEVALNLSGTSRGDVLALLRRIYDARDRLDLLVELLQRRSTMETLSPEAQATALCEMARIKSEHMGAQSEATEAFERALELDPRSLAAVSALRELAASNEQWLEVLELGRRELKLEEDADRRVALMVELGAVLYEHLDEIQQARGLLAEALELDRDNTRALGLLGRICFDHREWEEVAELVGRLVDQVRDQDDLHEHLFHLAFALERLDREEEAFRLYIRSFTRAPMYLPTLERMVVLCFAHRQWDNTLRIAETILESYPGTKSAEERAELYLRISLCELYLGQRDAGTEYLQQLVLDSGEVAVTGPAAWAEVAEPWASTALEPLLLHCMHDESRDRVADAARRCLRQAPDHPDALQLLAAVLLSRQRWDEGLRVIERAARSERTPPELGSALLVCAGEVARRRLGAMGRARAYLLWAKSLNPRARGITARIKRLKPSEEEPILLTRPKHRAPPPTREEPPIRKRDTRPFRSGAFDKAKDPEK